MGLALTYDELRQQVGFHLGFGTDPDEWNPSASSTVELSIKNGLRRFLFSSLVPGTRTRWEWSFLRKNFTMSTRDGASEYPLPNDFGSPDGNISFTTDYRSQVIWVNEAMIRAREAEEATGCPSWAALVPKPNPTVTEQQNTLLLFPEPDGVYALRILYFVNPDMLSEQVTNPHGGAPHARTLLLAILLESAVRVDSSRDFEKEHSEALAASIDFDSRIKGSTLGYNGDPSNDYPMRYQNSFYVTHEGVLYGD